MFGLNLLLLINKGLQVVLYGKVLQEYHVNVSVSQSIILGLKLFLAYINNLSLILLCVLMILLSIALIIRRQICDIRQSWLLNLNLTFETKKIKTLST